MQNKNLPGYDAIGFCVGVNDDQRFGYLSKSVWQASNRYPAAVGECGSLSEDYFRFWTRVSESGIEHVLESNPMPGLVGQVESFFDSTLVKTWIWDAANPESDEPAYPLCLRSPVPWFLSEAEAVEQGLVSIAVTILANQAEIFDNAEQLRGHPDLGRFGESSVVPTGLFVEEGEVPGPSILVIGRVLLAVRSTNQFSGDEFHALRVRTYGGEMFVNLPLEALDSDVTGKIIAVQGLASGSSPDWIPVPGDPELAETEEFELKGEVVEANLRKLCLNFYGSKEFKAYFRDIHATRFLRVFASIAGMFKREFIGLTKRRGKATWLTARRYRIAFQKAPVVMARIVMANTNVLYEGKSSPALVAIAFGEGADEAMDRARSVLARIHFGDARTPEEKALAAMIEDEEYQFGKRRRLPSWLVGNVEAYAADLWVPGVAAHENGLRSEVLVCFAEPGMKGLTATVPENLVSKAIELAKR